jgi:hypothetical protein
MSRLSARPTIGVLNGTGTMCLAALAPLQPHVPSNEAFLQKRWSCYVRLGKPLALKARADLDAFVAVESRTPPKPNPLPSRGPE